MENWNVVRILRLVAGLLIVGSAIADQQLLPGLLGVALALQAILNRGCGRSGCGFSRKNTQIGVNVVKQQTDYETVRE